MMAHTAALIALLCAHKDGPGGLRGPEEVVTEERIQHILTEASRAMSNASVSVPSNQPPSQEDSRSTDSKSPASSTHSPSPISRDGRPRPRKPDYDDIPQEKVARIYQEELAKLMTPRPEPPMPLHREQYPGILFPFLSQSLLFNRPPEEVKMAIDAYHQEISKLQGAAATGMGLGAAGLGIGCPAGMGVGPMGGNAGSGLSGVGLGAGGLHNGGAQDLTLPKREPRMNGEDLEDEAKNSVNPAVSTFGMGVRPKPEAGLSTASVVASSSSPLASLVTPLTSIATSSPDDSQVNASPLQRMARITNSLITAPPLSSGSALVSQKPLKAVLPPITQQQFDMYSNMNTEEIVKQVKEQLSQYSISQRLFGESVLGLSQGSVSDLLARPKPWHMLTQKGREPFIRMKMFLEDDNAVHKLVASQYKIAPEKLMRTGGYAAPPPSTSKPHIKLPADLPKTSMESPLPPVGIPSSLGGLPLPSHPPPFDTRLPLLDPLRKAGMGPRHPGPVAPSVYEMAALTQDLDTQVITTKIKEALLANNIGQKLFGEAVLGLSQGSVSELLSKPKPWHMLSIKGREPFIRMQMWINDPHNVEKLQQLKNERREASKRRRALDPTVEASTSDSQDMFQVPSPGGSTKKARVLFSEEQKEALRLAFALDPYPNMATIEFLSQELQLSTRTITNWFHNHRMRLKQQAGGPGSCGSSTDQGPLTQVPSPSRESQQPFDPLHFRLLLSQRLMELRKEKGLPPTLPGLTHAPGLGGLHAGLFPHFPPLAAQGFSHSLDRDNPTGLDLSMKNDNDYDSNASLMDEDSNMSGGMSPSASQRSEGEEGGGDREGVHGAPSPAARSSSRRKPAAPQWVNPSWAASGDSKEREVIINGVCVMQTDDYRHREEETVRIEPTAVDENRAGRSSTGEEEQENLPTTEEDLPPQLGGSGSRRSSPQPMEQDDQLQEASEEATVPSAESQEASSSQQPLTEREGAASGAGCEAENVVEEEEA